jgi:hypothetical protein
MCQKYVFHVENINQYPEYERTDGIRSKISTYLYEKINLDSKSDFEEFMQIQKKLDKLIASDEYMNKY